MTTKIERPWLERLKQHLSTTTTGEGTNASKTPPPRTDKTDNTPLAHRIVGFVGATPEASDDEIAWRTAAFRARLLPPPHPLWPPRIRHSARCDTPGHCSLCGDALPTDSAQRPRFPRCQPCIRALWLALNAVREEVADETGYT